MTTSYDDPRIADYTAIMSGPGGWTLVVWVRESFVPINQGPAKFTPGLRPKRLDRFDNSTAMVDLILKTDQTEGPCPAETFGADARAAGWEDVTWRDMVTDGGRPNPTFLSPDGGRSASLVLSLSKPPCGSQIAFRKPPAGQRADKGLMPAPPRPPQGGPKPPGR
jgi:hypothetical protein